MNKWRFIASRNSKNELFSFSIKKWIFVLRRFFTRSFVARSCCVQINSETVLPAHTQIQTLLFYIKLLSSKIELFSMSRHWIHYIHKSKRHISRKMHRKCNSTCISAKCYDMIYYAKHTSSYLEMEINYKNIKLIDMYTK